MTRDRIVGPGCITEITKFGTGSFTLRANERVPRVDEIENLRERKGGAATPAKVIGVDKQFERPIVTYRLA